MNTEQMDIVISWVDGSDSELAKKRLSYQRQPTKAGISPTRFACNNEIYYAIASILKYVPFCRRIYIVSDQQRPALLDDFFQEGKCTADKIQIIDHQQLFKGYEQVLPTFNSLTIESMLWNISDLTPYFIYMNDDFFFNSAAHHTDFIQDEKLVLFGHWQASKSKKRKYLFRRFLEKKLAIQPEAKYSTAQMLSADLCRLNRYFVVDHQPHILKKKHLQQFFLENIQIMLDQISHRFRHHDQFLPVGLNHHLAIIEDGAILNPPIELAYLKPNKALMRFVQQLNNSRIKYGCIQSLDLFKIKDQDILRNAMLAKFGNYLPKALMNQGEEGCNYSLT